MAALKNKYETHTTIAAIATPLGEGGVSIIRISGDNALETANTIFSGSIFSYQSHTVHYGTIHTFNDPSSHIDQGLAIVMKAPKSYTGEHVVELHCHGGMLITQHILNETIRAGARAALPGEFTFRAFQSGKLDLTQAEAVQHLIASKSSLALSASEQQLKGHLSKSIQGFQSQVTAITAVCEAWIDFPEEDLTFDSHTQLCSQLNDTIESIQKLYDSFYQGSLIHKGFSLCLLGAPNAGKSSLMNLLCQKDRAIVTNIPGTTRDTLTESISFLGLHFHIIDTAGLRDNPEPIEQAGMSRSHQAAQEADLILLVCDSDAPIIPSNLPARKEHTIIIWNKNDLESSPPKLLTSYPFQVSISTKTHDGIESLRQIIYKIIWQKPPPSKEEVIITQQRHHQALGSTLSSLKTALDGLNNNLSREYIVSDLRLALEYLGSIIGTNITEDVLDSIFSNFCVGK